MSDSKTRLQVEQNDLIFKTSRVHTYFTIIALIVVLAFSLFYLAYPAKLSDILHSAIGNIVFAAAGYLLYRLIVFSMRYNNTHSVNLHSDSSSMCSDDIITYLFSDRIRDVYIELATAEHTLKEYFRVLLNHNYNDIYSYFSAMRPHDTPRPLVSINAISFNSYYRDSCVSDIPLVLHGDIVSYIYVWYTYYNTDLLPSDGSTFRSYIYPSRKSFYSLGHGSRHRYLDYKSSGTFTLDSLIPNPIGITGVIHVSGDSSYYLLQYRGGKNVDGNKLQWSYSTLVKAFDDHEYVHFASQDIRPDKDNRLLSVKGYAIKRLIDEIYCIDNGKDCVNINNCVYQYLFNNTKPIALLLNACMNFQPELILYTDVSFGDIAKLESEANIRGHNRISTTQTIMPTDVSEKLRAGRALDKSLILHVRGNLWELKDRGDIKTRDIFYKILTLLPDNSDGA